MRNGIAALICAGAVVMAGCQDTEARVQNEQLRTKLEALEKKQGEDKDDKLVTALAAMNGGGGGDVDKKISSLSDDFSAGLDDIKKEIKDANSESEDRYDDLDKKIDKIADLEKTVASLKAVVDSLESKLKSIDPKEVLDVERRLISKEAELKEATKARTEAEAQIKALKDSLTETETEIEALKADIVNLEGDDVSRHPQYRDLKEQYNDLNVKLRQKEADYRNLEEMHNDLVERVKKGLNGKDILEGADPTKPDDNKPVEIDESKYDFVGKVVAVSSGSRPGAPSNIMISIESGDIPPKGAEVMVLGIKNERICNIKIVMHYHEKDDPTRPISELGGATVDEKITKPVAKGDKVVWVRKEEPEKDAAAGGN